MKQWCYILKNILKKRLTRIKKRIRLYLKKGGKDMKMKMDDVGVKIYVGLLKNIEESVKNGGEGVGELRELIEWGYSFGLENERIIKDLNVEVALS